MHHRELPLLGAVAGFLQWCEELLIIVSGPLLTVGLGIALVDLLTGGALLAAQPELLYAWAISQAAGVDAQLVASAAKLAAAFHARRYWLAAGYGVLIVPLAYVGFLASNVFATQQSQGLTTAEALARLGMDGTSWIVQRSALAVALVVLSGLLRYRPPAAEASAEDERERLARELELEPLRAQLRAQKARGLRDVAAAAMGKPGGANPPTVRTPLAEAAPDTPGSPPRPPTGGGTPMAAPVSADGASARTTRQAAIRLVPPATSKPRRANTGTGRAKTASREAAARAAWERGARSVGELERAAGVSRSVAGKYRRTFLAEAQTGEAVQ